MLLYRSPSWKPIHDPTENDSANAAQYRQQETSALIILTESYDDPLPLVAQGNSLFVARSLSNAFGLLVAALGDVSITGELSSG